MTRVVASVSAIFLMTILFLTPNLTGESLKPDPEAIWEYITQTSPYTQWDQWPNHAGMQPGKAPHGPQHKIYINDRLASSKGVPVSYGSIQVKENYTRSGKLAAITVMYKYPDYNPEKGDWYWVKYTRKGRADPFGKPKGCIECHEKMAVNDYIFTRTF